jgi:hypothetical protein
MAIPGENELLAAAENARSGAELDLLRDLVAFVGRRIESAQEARARIAAEPLPATDLARELHGFLREAWDALDGLGRLVNLCLYDVFPDAGLAAPDRMTRQCTFYTVRRALHAHPGAAQHPLSALLWRETREAPGEAYGRLSFLHNLSLFVPLPLGEGGTLPGSADVPAHVRPLVRASEVGPCGPAEGTAEMLEWLRGFAAECFALMRATLAEARPNR